MRQLLIASCNIHGVLGGESKHNYAYDAMSNGLTQNGYGHETGHMDATMASKKSHGILIRGRA